MFRDQGFESWESYSEGARVNKSELIDSIAAESNVSKGVAARTVESLITTVTTALQNGETVSLSGFGTFTVRCRAARRGRNPRTGEAIMIDATRVPLFKAGKALKDAVK